MSERYWILRPGRDFYRYKENRADKGAPHIFIANLDENESALAPYRRREDLVGSEEFRPGAFTPFHIDVDSDFRPNLIWESGLYVFSEAFISALDVDAGTVLFLPARTRVDGVWDPATKYSLGIVLPRRDAIDHAQSRIELFDQSSRLEDVPSIGLFLNPVPAIVIERADLIIPRADFVPDVDLFRDATTGALCVTDAIADRIVRSGVTDVQFESMRYEAGHRRALRNK